MADYKTLMDIDVKGKRVLIRLDLNVPIKEGIITDFTRIDACIPTINYVLDKGGIPILMSHLGRPEGKRVDGLSLAPVADVLKDRVKGRVAFVNDCVGEPVDQAVRELVANDVLILENLRFHAEEEQNEEGFVKSLSKIGEIFINDAFGTAHRKHASTYGVPKEYLSMGKIVGAGLLMKAELDIWDPIVKGSGYSVAVVGGGKLKEKMKAVQNLSKMFDCTIVGGMVANVFYRASGYGIGGSKYMEKDKVDYTGDAKELIGTKVFLPSLVQLASKDLKQGSVVEIANANLTHDDIIADVILSEDDLEAIAQAKRLVWFGPMGIYEEGFTKGTASVVSAIGSNMGCYAVVGGGDLAAATKGVNAKVSTGGGAAIAYITSGTLLAIEALKY